jgi:hypothetical protein
VWQDLVSVALLLQPACFVTVNAFGFFLKHIMIVNDGLKL